MALVRFFSPRDPDLDLSGVPVSFESGVADIPDTDPDRLTRMRYLGMPYGVVEMDGAPVNTGGLDHDVIAAALRDPSSTLGIALLQAVGARIVFHGTNAAFTRPNVNVQVWWVGTIEPVGMNGTYNDVFVPIAQATA